ncbi:Imm26 family immunity protein [Microcoleus sp. herbarium14]|uniref:Imm26 family immunity protein n=1 Tax=Microcoleus sp. herbarium14 TaxID=3055439 RepID=UPI002FD4FBC4
MPLRKKKNTNWKVGDVFAIPVSEKAGYMFGQIVFDIKSQYASKGRRENEDNYFSSFVGCVLIDVFDGLSATKTFTDRPRLIKGIFTEDECLEDKSWEIVTHVPINPKEVEFPDCLDNYSQEIYLARGELYLKTDLTVRYADEVVEVYPTMTVAIGIKDLALNHMGFPDLIERDFKPYLSDEDLRYKPLYRNQIYADLGEDPKESYYDIALKHGYDLARLYNQQT